MLPSCAFLFCTAEIDQCQYSVWVPCLKTDCNAIATCRSATVKQPCKLSLGSTQMQQHYRHIGVLFPTNKLGFSISFFFPYMNKCVQYSME